MWEMEIDHHNPLCLPYDGISLQLVIYFIYDLDQAMDLPSLSVYPTILSMVTSIYLVN